MRHLLLRLLASAPPFGDHVPDAELLRRFVASNDSAAFELIVHRHAGAVWAVCRRVLRSEADAEDAFQATFLALVRKAKSIRTPCAGGWLHRVAVNASLKLRERAARTASLEPNQLDAVAAPTAGPDTDLAAAVHEELARLSERERLPLVLCDLEGLSHADAATALGWPVGTVSGRLSRARAKLRERLARRGLAPSAALLPALPVPPHLIPNALSLTAGTAPPAVVSLAEGVLLAMRVTQLKMTAVILAATGFVALAGFVTIAAPPAAPPPVPPPAQPVTPVDQPAPTDPRKKPMEQARQIEPGITALAVASTDVIVADVLETNPSKAIEGARDTVKLKVVQSLLGRLASGDEIGVYYHLLWRDEAGTVLEPPRFERGKRYVVFLKSHPEGPAGGPYRQAYEPIDQWLWVQPDNARLAKDTAAAIRAHHGDARGEWSKPVGPLQARMVVYRDTAMGGTPILRAWLDVRNVAGGDNTVEFLLDEAKTNWSVTDPDGKPVKPTSPPGSWVPNPVRKLTLAAKEGGRLPLTISGAGIAPRGGGHLELASDQVWEFERDISGPHHLSGTVTLEPTGRAGRWSGTIDLPKVHLPLAVETAPSKAKNGK